MYRESIEAMRMIGRGCIEKRIKAVNSGEEVPNDILTQILQSCGGCDLNLLVYSVHVFLYIQPLTKVLIWRL